MEKSSLVMSLQPFFIQTHSVYLWHGVWQELFLPKTEILHRMRQVLRLLIHKNRWSQYYSSYFLIYRTCITIIHSRYRFLPLAPKSYSTLFAQMLTHIVLYHMPVWIGGVNSSIDASYWRACRSECLSIQKNCGPIPNLNCDDYEENDFFCYRILGSVFIILLMLHSPNSSFRSQNQSFAIMLFQLFFILWKQRVDSSQVLCRCIVFEDGRYTNFLNN